MRAARAFSYRHTTRGGGNRVAVSGKRLTSAPGRARDQSSGTTGANWSGPDVRAAEPTVGAASARCGGNGACVGCTTDPPGTGRGGLKIGSAESANRGRNGSRARAPDARVSPATSDVGSIAIKTTLMDRRRIHIVGHHSRAEHCRACPVSERCN
jgi:hypothetical protein